ncbi:putative oxidoreductase [Labrys miyagiensis]|uniref:Oxidoreductase n=1 Tax=Labrys miyagiensis TaxID=346912 RepID=A0ABQ6CC16_9HYPH|nr:Gfo/Idh/MocA family oxidoreductase [Labrys miyagiensis]GLS17213.1 putative oxidoreductase [Labrys miyagiensis]
MTRFRWGIFGTGAISAKFVAGLAAARNAEASFVASRSLDKAQAFAAGTGIGRSIAGYAEAAVQGGVDAVYIATPPSEHAAHALLCIEAGLPVLVEKPFASTAEEAARIAEAARARSIFAMEAMWTRFLPAAQAMRDKLAAGAVGDVRLISGNFGISQTPDPANSMFNAALGGGALAHLGAYPLSLGQWLFGSPTLAQATGTVGASGVDEDAAFQLRYPGGAIGSFFVSIRAWAPDDFQVLGTGGMLGMRGSIVRPHGLNLAQEAPRGPDQAQFGWRSRLRQNAFVHQVAQRTGRSSRSRGTRLDQFYAGNGYHYEADEVRICIERGSLESVIMPLDDSIAVAATTDTIRKAIHDWPKLGTISA